jgi:GT2 family glycosyltransferase
MVARSVTVAVVPRERFSFTQRSLESIWERTEQPFDLVYVDGGSPPPVRDYLVQQAARRGFRLIRADHYLTPNAARNLALAEVRTKYVVFIDNDALVSPNWLPPLVDCAESTGAWVVGPLYCEREPIATRIHMAGGEGDIIVNEGRRVFRESHRFYGRSVPEVRPILRREPVEMIEFHCVLVRMEAFSRLGPLDEELLGAMEHTDLCLLSRGSGGAVYFEPSSVVTYVPPSSFEASDRRFYQLRWSHAWIDASLKRFQEKWDLGADDPGLEGARKWMLYHRQLTLEPYRRALRIFGRGAVQWAEKGLLGPLEQAVNRIRFPSSRYATRPTSRTAA